MASPKIVFLKEIPLENLSLEAVFCIACRCIYLQPVTMPCGHSLCLECIKNLVNQTSFQCPICRMDFSDWLHVCYKSNWESLVNQGLWAALQLQYPVEVQKKLNNEDDGIKERIATNGFTRVQLQEGEIRKEYETMMVHFQQERKEEELKDLKLAEELQIQTELKQEEESNRCLESQKKQKLPKIGQLDSSSKCVKMLPNTSSLSNRFNSSCASSDFSSGPSTSSSVTDSPCTSTLVIDPCTSSSISDPCTSTLVTDPCTSILVTDPCTSTLVTDPSTSFSVTNSGVIENNLNTCSCGRLENNFETNLLQCEFCSNQMALFDETTQCKNDYLMAKTLQETYRKENFEDYNLRKRPASRLQKSNDVLNKRYKKK